jgi:hypothetical protein
VNFYRQGVGVDGGGRLGGGGGGNACIHAS